MDQSDTQFHPNLKSKFDGKINSNLSIKQSKLQIENLLENPAFYRSQNVSQKGSDPNLNIESKYQKKEPQLSPI